MRRIRQRLASANVISTLCLFLLLGGGAYAAFHLPKNSVRSRNIVNGQVKQRDLAKPQRLKSAGFAASTHGGDCPSGADQWVSFEPSAYGPVGYYRDPQGVVHLSGVA